MGGRLFLRSRWLKGSKTVSCDSALAGSEGSSPKERRGAFAGVVRGGSVRRIRVSAAPWVSPSGAVPEAGAEGGRSVPPRARLAWAVPGMALPCLRAERAPCELSGFLRETRPPTRPPPRLPSVSSTLGSSSPPLRVWGCLDLTETSQGTQQCAKSQIWKSRRMRDAVPASLGACEKETGESASVCQTPRFY